MTSSSFFKALEGLKRFNSLIEQDPVLRDTFVFGEWNYLQMHQSDIITELRKHIERGHANLDEFERSWTIRTKLRSMTLRLLVLFISGVSVIRLLLARPKVLIYSPDKPNPDHDFRIHGLYEYLSRRSIAYGELIHTVIPQGFYSSLVKRRRAVAYFEAIDMLARVIFKISRRDSYIDAICVGRIQDRDDRILFRRYGREMGIGRIRIRLLRLLLWAIGTRTVLSIDDPRHFSHELFAAARSTGIRSYAFQHGAYCKYIAGWIRCCDTMGTVAKPDTIFVWSDYWRQELLRLNSIFSPLDIRSAANPKSLETADGGLVLEAEKHEGINILMPYESAIPKQEVWAIIEKILKCPGVSVIFKPRPDRSVKGQLSEYAPVDRLPGNFVVETDLKKILPRIDGVIGVQSTMLFEMVSRMIPVLYLRTSLDYAEGLVINDLAFEVYGQDDTLCQKILDLTLVSRSVLEERKYRLEKDSVPLYSVLEKLCLSQ